MSYIPENRLGVGLAPGVSVLDNSAIREYFKASYGPHLSKGKMLNYLNDLIKQFSMNRVPYDQVTNKPFSCILNQVQHGLHLFQNR